MARSNKLVLIASILLVAMVCISGFAQPFEECIDFSETAWYQNPDNQGYRNQLAGIAGLVLLDYETSNPGSVQAQVVESPPDSGVICTTVDGDLETILTPAAMLAKWNERVAFRAAEQEVNDARAWAQSEEAATNILCSQFNTPEAVDQAVTDFFEGADTAAEFKARAIQAIQILSRCSWAR